MKEIEITGNISNIVESVKENFSGSTEIWFRGQSNYEYLLVPTIFRQGANYGWQFDEAKMYEEFLRCYPDQSHNHKNIYEWLTLMQHYGLPTRLLDWTSNLLVALYFCCNQNDNDAALFAFDPNILLRDFKPNQLMEFQVISNDIPDFYRKLIVVVKELFGASSMINEISIDEIEKDPFKNIKFTHLSATTPFESLKITTQIPPNLDLESGRIIESLYQEVTAALSNIFPFNSPHLNERVKKQDGRFTFHGGKFFEGSEFITPIKMEEHPYLEDNLVKIRIKQADKQKIMEELKFSGVTEATLFPEMEYQAREIRNRFTRKRPNTSSN